MPGLLALLSGLLFGAGLYVSMMAHPDKVLAFLDVAGAWDPSLVLVMAAAVAVTAAGFASCRYLERPLAGASFNPPGATGIDVRLIGGSAIFGIGWGMTGYCPGPGLAALAINPAEAVIYVPAMLAGMVAVRILRSHRPRPDAREGEIV